MQPPVGVYFRREDYASFWLRLLVDLIDIAIYVVIASILSVPLIAFASFNRTTLNLMFLLWLSTAFFYFVVLKRSRLRTPGYRIARVRIIAMDGAIPSYGALTLRLIFGFLGPFSWLFDLLWLSNDVHRQALRDTYVVKANAQPKGKGKIVVRYYDVFFYNFLFREVDPAAEP